MKNIFPKYIQVLFARMGIAVLMLFVTRIIFYLFNQSSFTSISFVDFLLGLWIDIITVSLVFIPYYFLYLLPFKYRSHPYYKRFFKILFHLLNTFLLGFNLVDVEYYKFTLKRTTFDVFSIVSAGEDMKQLFSSFVHDFWHLAIFLIIFIYMSEKLYRKTEIKLPSSFSLKKQTLLFFVLIPILIIIARGGFGLKPIGTIEVSAITKGKNTAFVINTPFTVIKTAEQPGIEPVRFFDDATCQKYFDPIKISQPANILPNQTNVVVILLESFGIEFIGKYNNGQGFTPFLDSLMENSLWYEYGFANGKKSIEAIPSIVASIPALMDNPYISSPYGDNQINTIPNILKQHGYTSAFFHGATNGSMRFDGFANICGFDHYFGRHEYNNDKHFDGTWGIWDENFNPWTARKITELTEPFFSILFTLSSHHPYRIPEHMKEKVQYGNQSICASINYADYALKKFFDEAKKQKWYKNTLFVLLADHTPSSKTSVYNQRTHMYRIPIIFFDPNHRLPIGKKREIFQQIDILPSILDLLNIKTKYYTFGNSPFQDSIREAITYINGSYSYFRKNFMTIFVKNKAQNLYDFTSTNSNQIDSISYYPDFVRENENRIKAMIQRYTQDLIRNEMTVE